MTPLPPVPRLFPYTTLFRSTLIKIVTGAYAPDAGTVEVQGRILSSNDPQISRALDIACIYQQPALLPDLTVSENIDRKSTRLNSSHLVISYAVFCLKKKTHT